MAAEEETTKEVARQNVKAMQPGNYDYILTLCASCGSHLKHNFLKVFDKDTAAPADLQT
ncbi:MAG: hypothetical protein JSV38_04450, partial [Desulfobacterales bacterium]